MAPRNRNNPRPGNGPHPHPSAEHGRQVQDRRAQWQAQNARQGFFQQMNAAAARAVAKDPNNPHLRGHLDAIIAAYEAYPDMNAVRERALSGLTPEAARERQEAWQALAQEMQGPGIVGTLIAPFFDRYNGSARWGGIAGGLAGLRAGYLLSGNIGGGSWIQWAFVALASAMGAWAGNAVGDWVTAAPAPSGPQVIPPPQRTPGLVRGPSPVRDQTVMRENDVNITDLSALPTPKVPNLRSQIAQRPGGSGPNGGG